jgi:cell division transport system permease protein
MRRFDYYFRETATGLRRNGIVAFAAMSTAFIALFLFALALVVAREFNLITTTLTGDVQVAVYLSDPVNPNVVAQLTQELQQLPAVAPGGVTFESKTQACAQFHKEFENQPNLTQNVPCSVLPASLRVKLANPALVSEITDAMHCTQQTQPDGTSQQVCSAPGVEQVADYSDLLRKLTTIDSVLRNGLFAVATIMLFAAVFLIANTLRMGMFARRKEIGIMRLVGATNWRIRVPFLIEGLVESLMGAAAAILGIFLVKALVIDRLRGQLGFVPLVQTRDILFVVPVLLGVGLVVAIIAGTVGMRRFLDV